MKTHTFTDWLYAEVMSSRGTLLTLYEQVDKMRFVDAPQLERQYMELIGSAEEAVIRQEIECELLEEKKKLVQAAINRREPVDEAAMNAKIDTLRQEKLRDAVGSPPPDASSPHLTGEQAAALQELYRKIVNSFHPQMHPEMTSNQKALFEKAQDAYRRQDMAALQLIYDMLTGTEEEPTQLTMTLALTTDEGGSESKKSTFSTDYSLAGKLYSCFVPTEEEAAIQEEWQRCQAQQAQVTKQAEALKQTFPLSAAEMLSDPAQVEAYKQQLEHRKFEAEQAFRRLTDEIQSMMERVKMYG